MIFIDHRSEEVAERVIPGHWEGNLLIGKNRQSEMGSLTERTTRMTILVPLKRRKAEHVRKSFEKELNRLPQDMRCALNYDQGREMAEHEKLTKRTKIQVYFAHKASPWEYGTNENTNGLIRQFFLKAPTFQRSLDERLSRYKIFRAADLKRF